MATSSAADEQIARTDGWHEPAANIPDVVPPEQEAAPKSILQEARAELWQPRYLILAVIILVLIGLQIGSCFET